MKRRTSTSSSTGRVANPQGTPQDRGRSPFSNSYMDSPPSLGTRSRISRVQQNVQSFISPNTSISPAHRRLSAVQLASTPEQVRINNFSLNFQSPIHDKSFGSDSFMNDSFLGALENAEKINMDVEEDVFAPCDDDIFQQSFEEKLQPGKLNIVTPKRKSTEEMELGKSISPTAIKREDQIRASDVDVKSGQLAKRAYAKKDGKIKVTKKKTKKTRKFTVAYTNRKDVRLMSESCGSELSKDDLSSYNEEDKLLLSSWGLPESIVTRYRMKGVSSLFAWQLECLTNEKVFSGKNLLYSAPTSAGKTLVAEILMLKRVLELGKKAIMILPFVSVAREKMYSLQELFSDAGVRVEGFMGSYNPPGGFKAVDIAVCTIEKANSLINKLLTENQLHQLGTVVVDELHLVGDSHRGYLLELLLTKLKFMNGRKVTVKNETEEADSNLKNITIGVQLIGMSATLPNLSTLATWLDAELVTSDYRPVPLIECIKIENKVFNSELQEVRELPSPSLPLNLENDPTHVMYLTLETILEGHSVLIFCPTKAWCEKLAEQIARLFFSIGKPNSTFPESVSLAIRAQLKSDKIAEVLEQLNQCPAGKDPTLCTTASYGVAFHHAGLTMDERDILESGFKRGVLRVIVATSTLSAGVNLPARRVIIVSPNFNGSQLDPLTYKQMSGRAGRKGVDTEGESVLICSKLDYQVGINLVQSSLPLVRSSLMGDTGALTSSMKRALLEVVASGVAKSANEVSAYSQSTFASVSTQIDKDVSSQEDADDIIEECLQFLSKNEFIKLNRYEDPNHPDDYIATPLGAACLASSLSPDEGLVVFKELLRARQCFVLTNELHVIYQVTPIYLSDQWRNLNWKTFLDIFESLSEDERLVGRLVGVDHGFIMAALMSTVSWKNPAQRAKLSVHQRFYTALALNDLVNEMPISEVARKYDVNKGIVQNLQQAASMFAGMVTAFCAKLGWRNLELLLSQFQDRLQFGVQRELCDLVRLSTLNGSRARILYNAGIETIADLAATDPTDIENIFRKANPFNSIIHDNNKDRQTVFVVGKVEALTEEEAAQMIVKEARHFLQVELGLKKVEFRNQSDSIGIINTSMQAETNGNHSRTEENSIADYLNQVTDSDENEDLNVKRNGCHDIKDPAHAKVTGPCCNDRGSNTLGTKETSKPVVQLTEPKNCEKDEDENAGLLGVVDAFGDGIFDKSDPFEVKSPDRNTTSTGSNGTLKELSPRHDELGGLNSEFEVSMSAMDISFSSLHLSTEKETSRPSSEMKDSEPMFGSQNEKNTNNDFDGSRNSMDFFDGDEYEALDEQHSGSKAACTSARNHALRKSNRKASLMPIPELKHSVYRSFQSHGRNMNVLLVECEQQLEAVLTNCDAPLSFGVKIITKRAQETPPRPVIGAKIMGIKPTKEKRNRGEISVTIGCYTGGDDLWIYEAQIEKSRRSWNLKGSKAERIIFMILGLTNPLIMMNSKSKLRMLMKYFGQAIWEKLIGRAIWDPRIAAWLAYDNHMEADDVDGGWISEDKLIGLFLDHEDQKVQYSGWPEWLTEAFTSWIIMKELKEKLLSIRLWNHFEDVEMQCILPIALMEINGFAFDASEYKKLRKRLKLHSALLELKAYDIVGRQFNFASTKELNKVLFEELKLQRPENSRGTGKDVLAKLDHVIACIISEWRKVQHALQLINPYSQAQNPETGRIHGCYAFFTVTGRLIMAEPSIQYIPRDFDLKISFTKNEMEKIRTSYHLTGPKISSLLSIIEESLRHEDENANDSFLADALATYGDVSSISMRNAFCTGSEEYTLVSADYSQLELRVLAILSKDDNLTRILNAGQDVFKSIAASWKNVSIDDVGEVLRQEAKAVVYAIIYGMGENSLSHKMNVTKEVAECYIQNFMKTYPGVQAFINKTITSCREKGYVETLTGRRRFLPNIRSKEKNLRGQAERQAVNTTVQGSASDLVKKAMVKLQRNLDAHADSLQHLTNDSSSTTRNLQHSPPCFLVLNLHDELIMEVRKDQLPSVVPIIREAMEKPFSVSVSLPVNIKTGPTWGRMYPYLKELRRSVLPCRRKTGSSKAHFKL